MITDLADFVRGGHTRCSRISAEKKKIDIVVGALTSAMYRRGLHALWFPMGF